MMIKQYVVLMRMHHYVKNSVVFFPLFFAGNLFNSGKLWDLLIAFIGEVALLLANHYIRKDEALIRSLDRLR